MRDMDATMGTSSSVYGIFFTAFNGCDWMGKIERAPDMTLVFAYRLRKYNPNSRDVWDDIDMKNWYQATLKPGTTVRCALAAAKEFQEYMTRTSPYGPPVISDSVVQVDGDQYALMAKLMERPWVHAMTFKTAEEADAFINSKEPN